MRGGYDRWFFEHCQTKNDDRAIVAERPGLGRCEARRDARGKLYALESEADSRGFGRNKTGLKTTKFIN